MIKIEFTPEQLKSLEELGERLRIIAGSFTSAVDFAERMAWVRNALPSDKDYWRANLAKRYKRRPGSATESTEE
jgi:hypothetical protein